MLIVVLVVVDYLLYGKIVEQLEMVVIFCYVQGCDYYKVVCVWLQKLVDVIVVIVGLFGYCVFFDLVLVMEVEFVWQVGFGWCGKYILLLLKEGFWCFFGEIYIDLLMLFDVFVQEYCGICIVCLSVCLIGVIVVFYRVDV